jgi:predicted HTH domain antitoxin
VVRTTENQETQLARVRERRELPTQQMAASTALTAGLRALGLEDAVRLFQQSRSLEEAAREVGLPVSEVFEHFLREGIPLMENEDALSSLAQLAARYQLPQLAATVTQIQQELTARPVQQRGGS